MLPKWVYGTLSHHRTKKCHCSPCELRFEHHSPCVRTVTAALSQLLAEQQRPRITWDASALICSQHLCTKWKCWVELGWTSQCISRPFRKLNPLLHGPLLKLFFVSLNIEVKPPSCSSLYTPAPSLYAIDPCSLCITSTMIQHVTVTAGFLHRIHLC